MASQDRKRQAITLRAANVMLLGICQALERIAVGGEVRPQRRGRAAGRIASHPQAHRQERGVAPCTAARR